ncbi:hypothetical protein [Nostoc sp. 'Peltigera membranacea cyanobiont' 232]|uniref:hypothetical protein n=1 Tax=Nostoc sp. 'Peltigera membranacea cyanobiont' 232 TaxID=2014531 RepID=UPI001675F84C|nr:hypothetical protein [Nostoc sp. 'Peltigera membranacea cyanobiont' 232]
MEQVFSLASEYPISVTHRIGQLRSLLGQVMSVSLRWESTRAIAETKSKPNATTDATTPKTHGEKLLCTMLML